jgi:hypothetical protein
VARQNAKPESLSRRSSRVEVTVASPLWVSGISTREPCQRDRERGVIRVGSFRHGRFRIAFTALRGPWGKVLIDFPCRGGRPLAWPEDEPTRQAVTEHLVEALRSRGELPSEPPRADRSQARTNALSKDRRP